MVAAVQLRRRRWATLALVLLVGVAGGAVMAAVAGARRTDTAIDRFVAYNRPEELEVLVNDASALPKVASLPQVATWSEATYMMLSPTRTGAGFGTLNAFGAVDGAFLTGIRRPPMVAGRLPRPDEADEVFVDASEARDRHLRVGSRLHLWAFGRDQIEAAIGSGFGDLGAPNGPEYTLKVVGIGHEASDLVLTPDDVVHDAVYEGVGSVVMTKAFTARLARDLGLPSLLALPGTTAVDLRLEHGLADLPAFENAVREIAPDADIHVGSDVVEATTRRAGKATHIEAIALLAFGVLSAVAALVVLGQALSRQMTLDAVDHPTLAALGLSRWRLILVSLSRPAVIALGGALVAVVVALLASPFTPIGLARRAEPHPGFSADVAVVAIGFVGVVAIVIGWAAMSAWRRTARAGAPIDEQAPPRPSALRGAAAVSSLGPTATTGIAMSLERGRRAMFGTAVAGTLAAVAGVMAAVTFGASLHHLVATPADQGWTWDVLVGNPNSTPPEPDAILDDARTKLASNPAVGAFAAGALPVGVSVNGQQATFIGLTDLQGSVFPPILRGRRPQGDGEVALGKRTLAQLHAHLGQQVAFRAGEHLAPMTVVGEVLIPTAGDLNANLTTGAIGTLAGARRLQPDVPALLFPVKFKPGVDRSAATASLHDVFGPEVLRPFTGGEVGDLAKVSSLPYVLASLLVVLGVGAMALTLLASVRRRRRDLAVLKTLGFVRRQVSATVAWQASILAAVALVVGVPCGVALGRWTWHLVASGLGTPAPPIVPLVALALVGPVTLLVANALAGGPGWAAGKVRPAEALRAE